MIRIRGFTLVELLVVISIIGILASIVTVNANVARRSSRDSKRKADIQNVAGALELYRATNRAYPKAPDTTNYAGLTSALSGLTSNIPTDSSYIYKSDTNGGKFFLDATLESTEPTTLPPIASPGSASDNVFSTGTYIDSGAKIHYRVSGP